MVTSTISTSEHGRSYPGSGRRAFGEAAQWCEHFQELCRARGIRVTAQRLAVYRALAEDTTHPTADSIYAKLQAGMSSLSPATVYRILEFLEAEGLVRRVSTTEGAGRFDANIAWHQHLVCRACGRMADYAQELPVELCLPRHGTEGFVAQEYDVRIVGVCQECRALPPPKRRRGAR